MFFIHDSLHIIYEIFKIFVINDILHDMELVKFDSSKSNYFYVNEAMSYTNSMGCDVLQGINYWSNFIFDLHQ